MVAVAAGVVTFAGEKAGYGTLVEVSHGNGLITRYGHNQSVAVGVGRTVSRGDTLAYVGSTGRSTGPHVHFEVLKNGRQIDPLTFIGRYKGARAPRGKCRRSGGVHCMFLRSLLRCLAAAAGRPH